MANLKALKDRIKAVRSTQKITRAMRVVSASKLRRARQSLDDNFPHALAVSGMYRRVSHETLDQPVGVSKLSNLSADTKAPVSLWLVCLSQKGLCGGFNSQLLKYARLMAESELSEGRDFRILALGERSLGSLGRAYPSAVLPAYAGYAPPMELADYIDRLVAHLEFLRTEHGFVEIRIFYQSFRSAVQQLPTSSVIWPMSLRAMPEDVMHPASSEVVASLPVTYEPDFASIRARAEASMLQAALYRILLHHDTSEHGARMTAMENATQAAGEMIRKLTLQYNRSRQAAITTELIEIISGAEALA